jgi:hypothetical protein
MAIDLTLSSLPDSLDVVYLRLIVGQKFAVRAPKAV